MQLARRSKEKSVPHNEYWTVIGPSNDLHPANRLRYHLIEKTVAEIKAHQGGIEHVADAGCGDASLLQTLHHTHQFKNVVGIDVSDLIVEQNQKKFPQWRFFAQDVTLDGPIISELQGLFDLVLSSEVIEHVVNDEAYVRNLQRLCRIGGYLILTTQTGPMFRMDREVLLHRRHYSKAQLTNLLKNSGFSVIRFIQTGFPWISLQKRAVELLFPFVRKALLRPEPPTRLVSAALHVLALFYRWNLPGLGPQILVVARREK